MEALKKFCTTNKNTLIISGLAVVVVILVVVAFGNRHGGFRGENRGRGQMMGRGFEGRGGRGMMQRGQWGSGNQGTCSAESGTACPFAQGNQQALPPQQTPFTGTN